MGKIRSALLKIDKAFMKVFYIFAVMGAGVILIIMLLAVFDVLASKIFGRSIPRASKLITYSNVATVFLGCAFVQLTDKHTTIDMVYSRFPKKLKYACLVMMNILSFLICGFITCRSWNYMMRLRTSGALSGTVSGFPIWPFAAIMTFGWITMAIAFLWSCLRVFTGIAPLPGITGDDVNAEDIGHTEMDCPR